VSAHRRIPRPAWACAGIAVAVGLLWAAVTPAFWVPDEPVHVGYASEIAETGRVPKPMPSAPVGAESGLRAGGTEEQRVIFDRQPFRVEGRPSWIESDARRFHRAIEAEGIGRYKPGAALYLVNYSPVYYGLEAVPFRLGRNLPLLERLYLMRALSALLGGITVLFTYMFLREALPGRRWAWTVGALAVAFQPLFGFMSGGVNNDTLLYSCSAALFFFLARAFRRGIGMGTGLGIGLSVSLGLLAKSSMLGLVPGAAFGVLVLMWRRVREGEPGPTLRIGAVTAATAAFPYAAWLVLAGTVFGRGSSATGSITGAAEGSLTTMEGRVSYLWQTVLPPLPSMSDKFFTYVPWETYFKGFVGRFGWFEYGFASGWYLPALAIFLGLTVLSLRSLLRSRPAVRRRAGELITYLALGAGLLLVIELAAYSYHVAIPDRYFEQARYLLPLIPLYGGFVALAAIGAGRRWARACGALLVVLAFGHTLFSLLLTVDRFYL